MSNQPSKPFTVVVGVDYSELSALALGEAVASARAHERSHVHVIHTVQRMPTAGSSAGAPFIYIPTRDDPLMTPAAEELRGYVEKVLGAPNDTSSEKGKALALNITTHVRMPYPAEAIAQLAFDVEADLVVVGTHGRRGMARLFLGSVAEGVVRLAPCPVLVVRPIGTMSTDAPKIDPPCARCIEARRMTDGKEFWCAQHREHHDRRHTYHFGAIRSGHQSGLLFHAPR